jgi:hypothetical protein
LSSDYFLWQVLQTGIDRVQASIKFAPRGLSKFYVCGIFGHITTNKYGMKHSCSAENGLVMAALAKFNRDRVSQPNLLFLWNKYDYVRIEPHTNDPIFASDSEEQILYFFHNNSILIEGNMLILPTIIHNIGMDEG